MKRTRPRILWPLAALLLLGGLGVVLARPPWRGAFESRPVDPAAGTAADDVTREVLVPLSGSDAIQVVSASQFHRFTLELPRNASLDVEPPADPATTTRLAEAAEHRAAGRLRSAARALDQAAAAAAQARLPDVERSSLLAALRLHEELDEPVEMLDGLERLRALEHARGAVLAEARAEADLGRLYGRLANYDRALDHLDAAAAAFEIQGCSAERVRALAAMGLVYLHRSEYGLALDELEAARSLLAEAEEHPRLVARVEGLLGNVYENVGDLARARSLYASALARLGDAQDVELADLLGNLGSVHVHLGENDQAVEYLEEARRLFETLRDARGTATALFDLGHVRKEQGGYRTALELFRGARDLQERDTPEALRSLCAIAETHLAMGQPDEALAEVRAALDGAEGVTTPTVRVELEVLEALVSLRREEPQRAIEAIRRALDLLTAMSAGLADEHVVGVREHRAWVFDIGLTIALRTGRIDLAVEFLEQGRAGALLEGLGGRGSRRGVPAALVETETRAAHRLARANRLYQQARAARRMKELRAADRELQAARTTYRTVEQRIQREAKRVASVFHPVPDSLTDVRGALDEHDVLVLYALLPFQAYALVVTQDDARVVWIGNTSDVRSACENLHVDEADEEAGSEEAVRARLRALARMVVEPLGLAGDAGRILVSPDGPLCYVPFPLLFGAQAMQVACLPSGTTLRLLEEEEAKTGEGALAVGDPTYRIEHQGHSLQVYAEGVPLEPLPATRVEVQSITGPGDMRLLGTYATVRQLGEVASARPRWRVIHLACHGLIDPQTPTLSALALTPEPGDDGFLTALEVYGMHLPADLVVLSGCNTGRGRFVKGEGLVGLMRAFMCAGTPRVIVSLWKVDDEATQALMSRFHHLLRKEGLSTAEALQEAQRSIAREERWRHPRYWGAWVLWGLSS